MAGSSENGDEENGKVVEPNTEESQDSANISSPKDAIKDNTPAELPLWKFTLILVALCITVLCMALVCDYGWENPNATTFYYDRYLLFL
jgi:hypothetical protein